MVLVPKRYCQIFGPRENLCLFLWSQMSFLPLCESAINKKNYFPTEDFEKNCNPFNVHIYLKWFNELQFLLSDFVRNYLLVVRNEMRFLYVPTEVCSTVGCMYKLLKGGGEGTNERFNRIRIKKKQKKKPTLF